MSVGMRPTIPGSANAGLVAGAQGCSGLGSFPKTPTFRPPARLGPAAPPGAPLLEPPRRHGQPSRAGGQRPPGALDWLGTEGEAGRVEGEEGCPWQAYVCVSGVPPSPCAERKHLLYNSAQLPASLPSAPSPAGPRPPPGLSRQLSL